MDRAAAAPTRAPAPETATLPTSAYAYLLGFYLGDGTISLGRKGVYRLRIFTDSRYPGIIEECVSAMSAVMIARRGSVAMMDCIVGPKS